MRTHTQFAYVYRILLAIVIGSGLLVWSLPTRGAEPEQREGPRALLQVAAHAPNVLSTTRDDSGDYNRYLQTLFALIKSRLVIDPALQQPGIAQLSAIRNQADPVAWLQQNLETIRVKGSEVVQVSLSPRSGASGKDQSAIINAVVSGYMQHINGAEIKRQADRHSKLKKIRQTYSNLIRERRETARKLSESVGSGGPLSDVEQNGLAHRFDRLLDRRLQLRVERAEAETLLERRKRPANRETDPVRKEIAQLEDRLAIVTAHERVLQDEVNEVAGEKRRIAMAAHDLKGLNEELAQMEDSARKVGAEVETLNIDLSAPPPVRVIEDAVPPKQ